MLKAKALTIGAVFSFSSSYSSFHPDAVAGNPRLTMYDSKRWKTKRERILRRDKYQCQLSKRYGRIVQANTVHHIFPRDQYPQYQWDDWNLISLSAEMHNRMHDRVTNQLTDEGLDLLRRTARKQKIQI